jgi:fido (protein-threonine AMPylation protein)/DNA-binding transcriptional ArsR family regulator
MIKITKRQSSLLKCICLHASGTAALLALLAAEEIELSEDTLQRDLKVLVEHGLVRSLGSGPSRVHETTSLGKLTVNYTPAEVDDLLKNSSGKRVDFNETIAGALSLYLNTSSEMSIFSKAETDIVRTYQQFISSNDGTILKRWRQKWLIEFAWKSSSIEGNTYSELETETLLIDKVEATGKSHDEATMIVNHQLAYDYIMDHKDSFKIVTFDHVLTLHKLLAQDLGISYGLRNAPVRISGSNYVPLKNSEKITLEFKKILTAINDTQNPLEKALAALLLISYLQPFADGNKRTARLVANAILESYNYPPITLGGIDPTRYRRACIAFYELGETQSMATIVQDSYKIFSDLE